jgi:hypothetical protein
MTTTTLEETLAKTLQAHLEHSEKLWIDGELSHACIIGYLQGTIKQAILELKSTK